MRRLLIANATGSLGTLVATQLRDRFDIELCDNGKRALELSREFQPDIILLDMQLPEIDGLAVLRSLRAAGVQSKVVVLSALLDAYICGELERLQVCNVFLKPCLLGSVLSCICEINVLLDNDVLEDWCTENEIDRILLDLGFRMGPVRYRCVHAAVMYKYNNPDGFVTKCLYPDLGKHFGSTPTQIEKSIRDAIKTAWQSGCVEIWQMYFCDAANHCPSNEQFLARIANILEQKTRIKKPYRLQQQQVK